jgi:methylated-DNA-[protein]-cysteine S-methyltransferase
MKSIRYSYCPSPVGNLLLVTSSEGLAQINFPRRGQAADPDWVEAEDSLAEPIRQLRAYFTGSLKEFELPLAPQGTPFQQKVWSEVRRIPYGETISYGELARRIGDPKASRAVGRANGSNPIPIIIPCHRVIGSNGKLTGYGGGLDIKQKLLALEKRQLPLL